MLNTELTKKEQQIYDLVCVHGIGFHNTKELEKYTGNKYSTIKTHLDHIYQKKFVHSMTELVWNHYQGEIANA